MMPLYVELVGERGSGLTTTAGYLSKYLGAYRLSSDFYRSMLYDIYMGSKEEDYKSDRIKHLYSYLRKTYPEIISADYNSVTKIIERATDIETRRNINNMLRLNASIIVDRHKQNDEKLPVNDDKYDKITIYVDSFNKNYVKENFNTYGPINPNFDKIDEDIIGMNMDYSSHHFIFDLKNITLNDMASSDYIISNNGTLKDLEDETQYVCSKIKKR